MRPCKTARLNLYGRFAFRTADNRDIAPKSTKSQALLALLATGDNGARGRLWLQKRLWPNSDTDKAAISLRQALSEIRRALGDDRDLLLSNHRSAGLNLDRVEIIAREPGQEFLEGLGTSRMDQSVGDWLHRQRQSAPEPMQACA